MIIPVLIVAAQIISIYLASREQASMKKPEFLMELANSLKRLEIRGTRSCKGSIENQKAQDGINDTVPRITGYCKLKMKMILLL